METSLKNLYVDLGGGLKGQKGWQESNTTNPICGKYASQKWPHSYLVRVLDMDAKAKFLKKRNNFFTLSYHIIITTDSLNRRAVLPQGCNLYHLSIGSMFCMLGHVRHFTLFTQGGCTASHTYDTSLAVFLSNRVLYIMATMTTTNLQHSPFSFDDLVL